MTTNLSDLVGFGAGGGGGGGGGTYNTDIRLHANEYNLTDESSYLTDTDLHSYGQAVRIRGLDNSTYAYVGLNCMTQNSSTPSSSNMRHTFTLFQIGQTDGAITKLGVRHMHNNSSHYYDYSTMCSTSDEWTGRYTYHGNIPHSGQSHTYSYHTCYVYGTGSGDHTSNHQNATSYYPAGNDRTFNSYVAPSERRLGGATNHVMAMYNSSSQASIYEFDYAYSTSSLNLQSTGSVPVTNPQTSTNYQVTNFTQHTTTNEPYYDAFHSFKEGLYARNRASQSWGNFNSTFSINSKWRAFHLSNGSTVLSDGGQQIFIDSNGTTSTISNANKLSTMGPTLYNWSVFAWNVGEDEWLQAVPGGKFLKFKFNPLNGTATISNILQVSSIDVPSYDDRYHFINGLWSNFQTSSVHPSGNMFTFGNENNNGPGYGRSKLVWMGARTQGSKALALVTYDIADLVSTLTYS